MEPVEDQSPSGGGFLNSQNPQLILHPKVQSKQTWVFRVSMSGIGTMVLVGYLLFGCLDP